MLTRYPVSTQEGLDALAVYATGVGLMKERSETDRHDPFGWFYQSRMHGRRDASPRHPQDPPDWSACQHGTWFFLPWHRLYLRQFESIIRSLTKAPAWGLPYWDYPNATEAVVPELFLDPQSPLHNELRQDLHVPSADPTWMDAGSFVMFGGGVSGTDHRGEYPGVLEDNPHNQVHSRFAGDLSSFQSPLDPLFWIHHANIDRLWDQWIQLGRNNPTASAWLETKFDFPDIEDPSGRRSFHVRDVATLAQAGYSYAPSPNDPDAPEGGSVARDDFELTLVGASTSAGSVVEHSTVDLLAPEALGLGPETEDEGAEAGAIPSLFLRLENVSLAVHVDALWNVFVTASGARVLAGTLAPFGLAGLTAEGGRRTVTFDVSRSASELLGAAPRAFGVTAVQVAGPEDAVGPVWERVALYTSLA